MRKDLIIRERLVKKMIIFNLAEKYLYSEFSIALSIDYENIKNYVINRVKEKCN